MEGVGKKPNTVLTSCAVVLLAYFILGRS